MTLSTLKSLKVGDKVECVFALGSDEMVQGEVVEVGYSAARILWNDEVTSTLHFNDPDPVLLKAISLL